MYKKAAQKAALLHGLHFSSCLQVLALTSLHDQLCCDINRPFSPRAPVRQCGCHSGRETTQDSVFAGSRTHPETPAIGISVWFGLSLAVLTSPDGQCVRCSQEGFAGHKDPPPPSSRWQLWPWLSSFSRARTYLPQHPSVD